MRHPSEGTLRRLVDEPAGVADVEREHVSGCPRCRASLVAVREDAAAVSRALEAGADPELGTDVETEWRRLSAALARGDAGTRPAVTRPPRRFRAPVVAGVGVLALATGVGAAAANGWLPIFQTEEVAPLTVSEGDLVRLPDLDAYGDLEVTDEVDLREVPDADAAEDATGLSLPQVESLPRGVTGEPVLRVADRAVAVFTFSAADAEEAAADGVDLPPVPAGLDGSRFRISAGPGVAAVWPSASGAPALVLARAVPPVADSSGVPFATAVDYLLSLPGLPPEVASQLRTLSGEATTLPLVVNSDHLTSETTEVDGHPATLLASRDEAVAGVVWVDDGVLTAVAGSLGVDEVLAVARGLDS